MLSRGAGGSVAAFYQVCLLSAMGYKQTPWKNVSDNTIKQKAIGRMILIKASAALSDGIGFAKHKMG
jgi:hypothetical protein